MYAFDVHCNSYFPLFVMLYVVQFALCPVLLASGFLPTVLSNLLYGVALSYYHYTQFLGYNGGWHQAFSFLGLKPVVSPRPSCASVVRGERAKTVVVGSWELRQRSDALL
jgi:hypothetical protein